MNALPSEPVPQRDTVRLSELRKALNVSGAAVRAYAGLYEPTLDTSLQSNYARMFAKRLTIPFPRPISSDPLLWSRDELIAYRAAVAAVEKPTTSDKQILRWMKTSAWSNGIHVPAQFTAQQRRRIHEGCRLHNRRDAAVKN